MLFFHQDGDAERGFLILLTRSTDADHDVCLRLEIPCVFSVIFYICMWLEGDDTYFTVTGQTLMGIIHWSWREIRSCIIEGSQLTTKNCCAVINNTEHWAWSTSFFLKCRDNLVNYGSVITNCSCYYLFYSRHVKYSHCSLYIMVKSCLLQFLSPYDEDW